MSHVDESGRANACSARLVAHQLAQSCCNRLSIFPELRRRIEGVHSLDSVQSQARQRFQINRAVIHDFRGNIDCPVAAIDERIFLHVVVRMSMDYPAIPLPILVKQSLRVVNQEKTQS